MRRPSLREQEIPTIFCPPPVGMCPGLIDRTRREGGFTLIELLAVVVIIGILSAIAIPNYLGQQREAKDSAAMAQLRAAATSQQLFHAREDAFAGTVAELEAFGFRQGGQQVTIVSAGASTYCMQAPGGNGPFKMTHDAGGPAPGPC